MPTPGKYTVEEEITADAPVEVLRELITDVERWPQLHRPAVHAEFLERKDDEALIQHWAVTGDRSVRTWKARRWIEEDRIVVAHEPAEKPLASVGGEWVFTPAGGGRTLVTMRHEFVLHDDDARLAAAQSESMRRGARAYLDTLKYAAEARDELAELIISFEDPLFIAGSIEDVYAYLYEADKWPERIPHVARLVMEETTSGIQFFDMDTVSADGSAHTTRSVRVCLPYGKIVYKQTQPPKTMHAHTGHWVFTETPEGVIASARHTATIRTEGLHLLGEGTTVQGARKYLRKILSANSMGNLRLAKEYAEERATLTAD